MARRKVCVCYSHKDRKLFEGLLTRAHPLKWKDQEIMAGEDWEPDVYRAIDRADVAVVLGERRLAEQADELAPARRAHSVDRMPSFQ